MPGRIGDMVSVNRLTVSSKQSLVCCVDLCACAVIRFGVVQLKLHSNQLNEVLAAVVQSSDLPWHFLSGATVDADSFCWKFGRGRASDSPFDSIETKITRIHRFNRKAFVKFKARVAHRRKLHQSSGSQSGFAAKIPHWQFSLITESLLPKRSLTIICITFN